MNSTSNISIRAIPEIQTGLHSLKTIAPSCGLVLGAVCPCNLWLGSERPIFLTDRRRVRTSARSAWLEKIIAQLTFR